MSSEEYNITSSEEEVPSDPPAERLSTSYHTHYAQLEGYRPTFFQSSYNASAGNFGESSVPIASHLSFPVPITELVAGSTAFVSHAPAPSEVSCLNFNNNAYDYLC